MVPTLGSCSFPGTPAVNLWQRSPVTTGQGLPWTANSHREPNEVSAASARAQGQFTHEDRNVLIMEIKAGFCHNIL